MRLMVYEGTPEEISQVAAALRPLIPTDLFLPDDTAISPYPPQAESGDKKERVYISVEVARRMFTRIPLAPEPLKVFQAIYEAHPDRVSARELQKLIGYTPAQLAGLMGALGRRMAHTDGYGDNAWLFDTVWDYDNGCYQYGLPETVREALRQEKLVSQDAMRTD